MVGSAVLPRQQPPTSAPHQQQQQGLLLRLSTLAVQLLVGLTALAVVALLLQPGSRSVTTTVGSSSSSGISVCGDANRFETEASDGIGSQHFELPRGNAGPTSGAKREPPPQPYIKSAEESERHDFCQVYVAKAVAEPASEADAEAELPTELRLERHSDLRYTLQPYGQTGPIPWSQLGEALQRQFASDGGEVYRRGGGKAVRVIDGYIDEAGHVGNRSVAPACFNRRYVEDIVVNVRNRVAGGFCSYGESCGQAFLDALEKFPIEGKSVLVVGSQSPWAEALAIGFGASMVTTVDLDRRLFEHEKIRCWSFADLDASGDEVFDVIISFSSLEHDGLGRYGDPIHPNGDILRVRKLRGMIKKPDGLFLLGFPIGNDTVVFNSHRIYGPLRMRNILKGWRREGVFGGDLEETYRTNVNADWTPQLVQALRPA